MIIQKPARGGLAKFIQFHFVLQDLEHGVGNILAKIGFTVERIDSTKPLSNAAIIAFELFLLLEELVHFDESHRLPFKIYTLLLIAQLHLMTIIRGFLERVEKMETDYMQIFQARKLSNLFHSARKASHVKNQTVILLTETANPSHPQSTGPRTNSSIQKMNC